MLRSAGDISDAVVGAFLIAIAFLSSYLPCWRKWGATEDEVNRHLPGDELVSYPKGGYTQAITVRAPRSRVWPWVAQIGQDRGGFYSYDFLENLVGCDIHSVDKVMPEHQHDEASPGLKMHPQMPPIPLVAIDPERTLLFGGKLDPDTPVSWLFFLEDADESFTRLLARWLFDCKPNVGYRIGYGLILQPIACVMQRKMLLGIKERAERPG